MLFVPFNGEQRFGCHVPGLWRTNARDFDDADVSSRSILRSSQPCFPEILECDGHANATCRCSRDKFVLFDIMWLAVILGWNFPSNPEANYFENVLAECFPADRNPHNFWVGVCEPTLDSRAVRVCGQLWSAHRCWLGLKSRLQLDRSKTLTRIWWSQTFVCLDACFVAVLKEEMNLHFQLSTWGLWAKPDWYLESDGDSLFPLRDNLPWSCCHHHSSLHLCCSWAVMFTPNKDGGVKVVDRGSRRT